MNLNMISFFSLIINSGTATLKSEEKKATTKSVPLDPKDQLVFKNYFDFTIQTKYAKPHQV